MPVITMTKKSPKNEADAKMRAAGNIAVVSYRPNHDETALPERLLLLQHERMPLACITNDRDFRITSWNPAAERIFGYSREEAVGKHPYELFVPPDQVAYVESIRERIARGEMDAHGIS